MIGTLTRRNIGSHKGRSIIISLSIMLGVAFVSASFMVADSLRATFDNLFNSLSDGVDLEVRSQLAFGDATDSQRDPISIDLRDQIAGVEGVADTAVGLSRSATIIDKDGEPVKTSGAPTLAVAWDAENNIGGAVIRDGRLPAGPDEVVIDKATADKYDFEVGDPIEIVVQAGREQFTPGGVRWTGPTGGMLLWLTLPEGSDTEALLGRALEAKVAFVPGRSFHASGGGGNTMRLNFSHSSPAQIVEGVRRLGSALRGEG